NGSRQYSDQSWMTPLAHWSARSRFSSHGTTRERRHSPNACENWTRLCPISVPSDQWQGASTRQDCHRATDDSDAVESLGDVGSTHGMPGTIPVSRFEAIN